MTNEEMMLDLAPKIREIKRLVEAIPESGSYEMENLDQLFGEITLRIYDACRDVADEQIARNRSKYRNPEPLTPTNRRPTLDDVL